MLTQKRLKELLHYDPETGIFTWLQRTSNRISVGDAAGCYRPDGYYSIRIDDTLYLSHRLAYLYMMGKFPTHEIDHINMIRDDNRWVNLRSAKRSQNQANGAMHYDNISGYKGVSRNGKYYEARICINYKCIRLGLFDTAEEAHAAYAEAAKKYFGEYARTK